MCQNLLMPSGVGNCKDARLIRQYIGIWGGFEYGCWMLVTQVIVDVLVTDTTKPLWKRKSSKSSVFQLENLEDPVGGKVIGGISHVLEYLFTLASTWLVSCLQIQSWEKLSKRRSQCSVNVLASAHFLEH